MKHIISLLLIVGFFGNLYAQYPNTSNKMRLGAQTTGDGLVFRTDSIPDWTPSNLNNAWLAIDTLTGNAYSYQGGEWRLEVAGDLRTVYPQVINKSGVDIKRGQPVMVDYTQIIQGDLIRILPADGSGTYAGILTMGIASTDITNNAEGFITWFGYVREVKQADIAETGVTLNVGDILYLSGTQLGKLTNVEPTAPKLRVTMALVVRKPNANNMTILVRPNLNSDLGELNDVDLTGLLDGQTIVWDSAGGKWIAGVAGSVIDTTVIATRAYVDGKVDSTRLVADSILVYYIAGVEVGRDTISGVGGSTTTTFTIETGQQLAFVVVDDNNATPWDGLSVIGVFFTAPANEATFTVNGVVQTLTFPTPAPEPTQIANIHVAAGLTTLSWFDAERLDFDQEGVGTYYASSLFVADSSSITYIGTENIYVKVYGVASFVSNANATLNFGVSLVGNSPPAGVTSSFIRVLNGVQLTAPTQTAIFLISPNTKFELVAENTTNVTVSLATYYSLTVEKINQ
jgi:hypothetical protein